jgi:hypothetical protein
MILSNVNAQSIRVLVVTLTSAAILTVGSIANAKTIIRLESCKDAAAVYAAGQAETDASSSQELGISCNSDYSKIQQLDDLHYQVHVTCVDSAFTRSYRVAVKRKGEFCGGTSAKTISFVKEVARK